MRKVGSEGDRGRYGASSEGYEAVRKIRQIRDFEGYGALKRQRDFEETRLRGRHGALAGNHVDRKSDQHRNCFKGNIGETPERRGGAHMGLPKRIDTIWN